MKTSTKFLASAIAAVAILFGTQVKAQTTSDTSPWRLGIGVEGLVPTGNLHNGSNVGIGGTARLQYGADKGLAYTLTSGYYNFFPKGNSGGTSGGLVPVKAGIKAYFVDKFYFGAEAGAGFETTGIRKDTKLILSPGLGYSNHSWDVGARYEQLLGQSNNYGFAALRVAYGFSL